ncbi:MAG: class I SAM-dependent RNA methyltransferase [Bacteroidota bacterium]
MEIIAKTFQGLESVLAEELKALGAKDVEPIKRGVRCFGDQKILYRLNYCSRLALRFLAPLTSFKASHPDELYDKAKAFPWSDRIRLQQTFAIHATVFSDYFKHSGFAALRLKDAIADHFVEAFDQRPNVDLDRPDFPINLHIAHNRVTILLDSSGSSLHLRGYKTKQVRAPLNEVLAAGLLRLAGWPQEKPFLDPMCGSGTIPIEALMMARNMPPQKWRPDFAFMHWPDFKKELWEEVKQEAEEQIKTWDFPVLAADKNPIAIKISTSNAKRCDLHRDIHFFHKPFEKLHLIAADGFILMNPPYDARLEDPEIERFYKMIGDLLKQSYSGYEAWIFSGNLQALKRVGLRPSRKIPMLNGKIESKLQQYLLYKGSKKQGAHTPAEPTK